MFLKACFYRGVKSRDRVVKLNSLPKDEILDRSKLKAYNYRQYSNCKVEKHLEKGENAGYPAFSPYPTIFTKAVLNNVLNKFEVFFQSLKVKYLP